MIPVKTLLLWYQESSKEEKTDPAPSKEIKPDGKEKGKDGAKDKPAKDKEKGWQCQAR